jgi:hypothetical protein
LVAEPHLQLLLEQPHAHADRTNRAPFQSAAQSRRYVDGTDLAATELAVSTGARSEVDLALAASARHTAEVDLISARVGVAVALVGVIAASGDDVQL